MELEIIEGLDTLFGSFPDVPCVVGCTGCCVSPHITPVEFCRTFHWCQENFEEADFKAFLFKPAAFHPNFEGNLRCRFHRQDGYCGVHPGRPMACRLHGLPVIEEMGIANLENCTIMPRHSLPKVQLDKAQGWLKRLVELNRQWYPQWAENEYGLKALNVECWIDLLYGTYDLDAILDLQERIRQSLPGWEDWKKDYKVLSSFSEKLDAIFVLKMSLDYGDLQGMELLATKIRDKFADTGTWFKDETEVLLSEIIRLQGEGQGN